MVLAISIPDPALSSFTLDLCVYHCSRHFLLSCRLWFIVSSIHHTPYSPHTLIFV